MEKKIDQGFYKWGEFVIRFRYSFLSAILGPTIFFALQIPKLTFDTSNESFFKKDNPTLLAHNNFREQFGGDEIIIVMVESKNLFTYENLSTIKKLHHEIEDKVPLVNDIKSLTNARVNLGEEGALIVKEFLEEIPKNPAELAKLKEYILTHPVYRNFIISKDGSFTLIAIKRDAYSAFDSDGSSITSKDAEFEERSISSPSVKRNKITGKENTSIVFAIKELIENYNRPDFKVYYSGTPVVATFLKGTMKKGYGLTYAYGCGCNWGFPFSFFSKVLRGFSSLNNGSI